ncbi:MAG TPA: glycine oxidase ThiO [Solirubrobacteraceae bacterium]|nr:glycine oxidase ThiO [Solirubrobacteraceae bacterium]
MTQDVIVVGGGVIGLTAGWRLSQRGLRVTVLERDEPGSGTSRVAAGMLAPIAEADLNEQPLLRLGVRSAALYPAFVEELRELSGCDPGYLECGSLLTARDRDEAESVCREQAVRERLELAVFKLLPGDARALEPGLAPALRLAMEIPDDHAIDPRALVEALVAALERAGVSVRRGAAVERVELADGRIAGVVLADGARLAADHVVIAAGAWSDAIAGLPEHARVALRPVKGQIIRLHDPAGPGLLTRVLRMRPAYIVPRGDGRYVLGATMEERGFDTTVTAGAIYGLLRDAIELLPGLSELVIDGLDAGLRPGTPDNAPLIGPGAVPGLHWATGHYRNGILLAPITAELIVESVLGSPPQSPFSPDRFSVPVHA